MQENFIKIDRKILQWEWYKNEHTKNVFLHCLLKAYWKEKKYEGKIIPRGSFISSIGKMAEETGLTPMEVRTALKHLKLTNEVTSKGTNKNTVFTVTNYDLYQSKQQAEQQTDNKQITNKQQTINKQLTINEEYKEDKKDKESKKDKYSEETKQATKRIIDYLNEKCGTRYRPTTENTIKSINARLAEGYTEDDFYIVIDKKCDEWIETKWEKFLKPDTLFTQKHFDAYLNQKNGGDNQNGYRKQSGGGENSRATKKNEDYGEEFTRLFER